MIRELPCPRLFEIREARPPNRIPNLSGNLRVKIWCYVEKPTIKLAELVTTLSDSPAFCDGITGVTVTSNVSCRDRFAGFSHRGMPVVHLRNAFEPLLNESDDLLAGFTYRDQRFFLKRRWIEQRGERSLFETQYVLKQLLKQGFPATTLWSSPEGETLIKGPDWEEEREVYYEIQHRIFGSHFQLTAETAHDAGAFVARFHQAGERIDTFLLGKAYWTHDFIQKRFRFFESLLEQLRPRDGVTQNDIREVETRIDRHCSILWRKELTWGLAHGDLCANNLLISTDLAIETLLSSGEKAWHLGTIESGSGEVEYV